MVHECTSDDHKKQMSGKIACKMMQECQENSPPTSSTNENVPSTSQSTDPVAKVVASESPLDDLHSLLTSSQEQLILQESNFNIQNAATSTVQHFHFHGPVTFYNNNWKLFSSSGCFELYDCFYWCCLTVFETLHCWILNILDWIQMILWTLDQDCLKTGHMEVMEVPFCLIISKAMSNDNDLFWCHIKQITNAFSFVQWNKYFHSVKDEMFDSTCLRLVEWNISSFTS